MTEFSWHRMHKHEEQIENDVYDRFNICFFTTKYVYPDIN